MHMSLCSWDTIPFSGSVFLWFFFFHPLLSPAVTLGDLVILVILLSSICLVQICDLPAFELPYYGTSVKIHSYLHGGFWYRKTPDKHTPSSPLYSPAVCAAVAKSYPQRDVPMSREEGIGCALRGSSFFSFQLLWDFHRTSLNPLWFHCSPLTLISA